MKICIRFRARLCPSLTSMCTVVVILGCMLTHSIDLVLGHFNITRLIVLSLSSRTGKSICLVVAPTCLIVRQDSKGFVDGLE